jgi:hypothetical protein
MPVTVVRRALLQFRTDRGQGDAGQSVDLAQRRFELARRKSC